MKLFKIILFFNILFFAGVSFSQTPDWQKNYPADWWKPVPREGAPTWEILPQDAKENEVILSKRNELGILSNFADTPFSYKGVRYKSIEGFWQMMKYPEDALDERNLLATAWPYTRAEVSQMVGFSAKDAGSAASSIMKKYNIDWVTFEKQKMPYKSLTKGLHYQLIYDAMKAKLDQNSKVKEILIKTKGLTLKPDHTQGLSDPPEWRYYEIWMELRNSL